MTPAVAFISLSANYLTISVNSSLIVSPTDLGSYAFTLIVNSANF
jgi:hypothetical protein